MRSHQTKVLPNANWECMTEDEQKACSYIWVEPSKISADWRNDPDRLGAFDSFCPTDYDYVAPLFQKKSWLAKPPSRSVQAVRE